MKEVRITTTIELSEKHYGIAILLAADAGETVEQICSGAAHEPCEMAVEDQLVIMGAVLSAAKAQTN